MIQTMLYGRRFFPYYVYNILGGIEEDGESAHPHMLLDNPSTPARWQRSSSWYSLVGSGAVYSFDPVGSYEREACRAAGAAQSLVQPFLDNQVSVGILLHFSSHRHPSICSFVPSASLRKHTIVTNDRQFPPRHDNSTRYLGVFAMEALSLALTPQIYFKNQVPEPGAAPFIPGNLPLSTVLGLVVDSFTSATERHIEVGDGLEVFVVMNKGRTTDDLLGEGQLAEGMEIEELGALGDGGERTFLVKRALKRD
jgi:hypothetical protein